MRRERTKAGLWLCVLWAALIAVPWALPAHAATPTPAPATASATAPLSTEDLKNLVATLQNEPEREKFIGELKALIAARQAGVAPAPAPAAPPQSAIQSLSTRIIAGVSSRISGLSVMITDGATALLELPAKIQSLRAQATEGGHRRDWLRLLGKLAIVLGLAIAADWTVGRALRRPLATLRGRPGDMHWVRTISLVGGFFIELVPIVLFGAVVYLALPFVDAHQHVRLTALAVVNAVVSVRALLAVGRLVLSPQDGRRRPIAMADETAGYWYVWLRRLASIVVYGYFADTTALLLGLPPAGFQAIAKLIGLITTALVIVLILQNRHAVARAVHGADAGTAPKSGLQVLRARFAEVWHILALVYVVVIYAVWALQVPDGFEYLLRATLLTIVIGVAARAIASGTEGALKRFFSIGADLKKRFPALEARADRYLPALLYSLHTIIYLIALVALFQAWGIDVFHWLASDPGRRTVSTVATIALTVVIALLCWEAFTISGEVYLSRKLAVAGVGGRAHKRAHTLMPLIRRAIAFLLAAVSVLIILSALGVNVGPLLAGLGVVGIAIGLGAQSLVKDLITGIMIVMDDTIAVGDVVTLGNGSGEVEQISIHALKLRDGNGALHTIPFSSMTSVINATKDFSIANLSIPIGYRENVDRVIGEIERLGREIQDDAKFKHLMLGPLQVGGLDQFADYAMILSAAVKTPPGQQGDLVHEFNRRLKRRFDALGIEMPYRTQAMIVGGGDAAPEPGEEKSERPEPERPQPDRPQPDRPDTSGKESPGEKPAAGASPSGGRRQRARASRSVPRISASSSSASGASITRRARS